MFPGIVANMCVGKKGLGWWYHLLIMVYFTQVKEGLIHLSEAPLALEEAGLWLYVSPVSAHTALVARVQAGLWSQAACAGYYGPV